MSEKENNIDDLFKGGLDGHKPDAPEGVWGKLSEDLKGERNFHPVDDLFYDRLAANEAKPPLNVWGRIRNGLGNTLDAGMQSSLDGFEPTPPNWIWQSLSFMLLLNRRNRARRRAVLVTGTLGMLALIGLLQWGLYNTMPSFEVNETKDIHKLKVVKGGRDGSGEMGDGSGEMEDGRWTMGDGSGEMEDGSGEMEDGNREKSAVGGRQSIVGNSLTLGSVFNPLWGQGAANNRKPLAKAVPTLPTGRQVAIGGQLIESPGNLVESKSGLDLISLFTFPIFSLQPSAFSQNPVTLSLPKGQTPNSKPKTPTASPWSIAVLASADRSFHSLKGAPSNEYLLIRNSSEKAKTTLSYALRLKYNLSNHLSVSTGMSLVQRGEKAEYDFKTQQESQTMVGFYINGVYELKPYKNTFTKDHKQSSENSYTYLEVPMALGYRFDLCCFSVQPTVGVSAGWLTAAKGTNLTMELNPSLVNLDEMKKQSMNRLNVGGNISVAVSVPVAKKMRMVVEPFFNHSLNNSLRNNMDVKQYFHSKGIMAGFEWKL